MSVLGGEILADVLVVSRPQAAVDGPDLLPGTGMTWTGADGSTWDLTGPDAPVRLLAGVTGHDEAPPFTEWSSTAPAVPGVRHRGSRVEQREAFWPVLVSSASWESMRDTLEAWWASLHPDAPGMWTVTLPDGSRRSLPCCLRRVEVGHEVDPFETGRARFDVYLRSDEGLWVGAPVLSPIWRIPDPVPFVDTGTGAPPFHISRAQTAASASMSNPGDVDAWPTVTITGPTTEATLVTIAGQDVSFPPVAEGDVVIIDYDPRRQTATNAAGDDVTPDLVAHEFRPIPARQTVQVGIDITGAGSVRAAIVPRFWRGVG